MFLPKERLFGSLLILINLQPYNGQPEQRPCSTLKTKLDCIGDDFEETHDCQWCTGIDACATLEEGCPVVVDGTDEDGVADPTDIFGSEENKNKTSCISWNDEESCMVPGSECQWCDGPMVCHPLGRDCPVRDETKEGDMETETGDLELNQETCIKVSGEKACVADATCIWCPDRAICQFGDIGCPGKDNGNDDTGSDGTEKCVILKNKEDCGEAETCIWCDDQDLCQTNSTGCPGLVPVGPNDDTEFGNTCNKIKASADCISVDVCVWCEENESCRSNSTGCPESNGEQSDSENGIKNESTGIICSRLSSSEDCLASDSCLWCEEKEICRSNSTGCPGTNDKEAENGSAQDIVCNKMTALEDCTADESCIWCDEKETCRSNRTGCPGSVGQTDNEMGRDNVCNKLSTSEACLASDPCVWCEEKEMCRSNATGCPGSNGKPDQSNKPSGPSCPSLSTVDECLDSLSECFWCTAQSKCRKSFADCPGNERLANKRPNVCASIRNETECGTTIIENDNTTLSCTWCAEKSLCREDTKECPGRGRGNPCHTYDSPEDCESDSICTWFDVAEKCTAARGMNKNVTVGDSDDNPAKSAPACPLLTSLENCTSEVSCRWCPEQERCQKASQSCPNGGLGKRGNPCPKKDSESNCTSTDGCLWCVGIKECKKAVHDAVCEEVDAGVGEEGSSFGNSTDDGARYCRLQDAAPECNEQENCQWCEAQSRCRPFEANCLSPTKKVGVELFSDGPKNSTGDGNGQRLGSGSYFKVQDQGLGLTDPNAVAISLSHLFEITESGETIESSLVDLSSQDYQVKQFIGQFFGNSSIQARKLSFKAKIDDVGKIEMDAYIIMSNGTITTKGDESWDVVEGDVKFNVILKDWIFCGDTGSSCEDQSSAYVDVALEIKGKSDAPQASDVSRLLFNLGGNVPLLLSAEVEVDGIVKEIPPGFPRLESAENQGTTFVFRFPRFRDMIEYDPIVPYSAAVITDLSDGVTEDDVQATMDPTVSPVAMTDTPTGSPSIDPGKSDVPIVPVKRDSDDSPSILLIVGIALVGMLLCCGCCFVIVKKFIGSRNTANVENDSFDKGHQTAEDEDPDHYWDDEGMTQDVEAQETVDILRDHGGPGGGVDEDEDDDDDDDDDDKSGDNHSDANGSNHSFN